MLTHLHMKWVPLLIIGGGTGIYFHLLQGVLLPLQRHLSDSQDKLQCLWWRLGRGSSQVCS